MKTGVDEVTAKRKILVEGLVLCLQKSRVCEVVSADTVRMVFESASSELWREGEFRLEVVWKILCQQPGLDARAVAPPLLAFKGFEEELGVRVILPEALSSLPRGEQERLRETVDLQREPFANRLRELRTAVETNSGREQMSDAVKQAASGFDVRPARRPSSSAPDRRPLAFGLTGTAVVSLSIGLYVAFGGKPAPFDVSDVNSIVRLEAAIREGKTLVARISDPRWETLNADEQHRLAGELLDREAKKGVEAITLKDGSDHVRVIASLAEGAPQIFVR